MVGQEPFQGTVQMTRRAAGWVVGTLTPVAVVAGCASAPTSRPRKMPTDDFEWLAGEWKGGEALDETPTSQGKMTFQESATEWIWQWPGKTKIGDKNVTREYRKSK